MVDTANSQSKSDSSVADRVEDALFGEPEGDDTDETSLDDNLDIEGNSDEVDVDDQDDDDGVDYAEDNEPVDDYDEPTLASYLGLDETQLSEDDDGNVMFNANVNGELSSIPISKLVQGYQTDGYNTQRSMKLSEDIKTFEEERTRITEESQINLQKSMHIVNRLESELLEEYNRIDWQILRENNPTEFVALRQDYADKANRVEQMKSEASNAIQEWQLKSNNMQMEATQKHIAEQRQKLIDNRPELANTELYTAAMSKARKFVFDTYGVSEEEVSEIYDHRLVSLILDAQQFHLGKQKITAKKKSGKKIPKFNKSGGIRIKASASKKAKAKRQKLSESGTVNDAANLLIDRM